MIDSEYGNDILTLEDDDGVEHTFEVLDSIENAGTRYLALSPVYDDPQQTLADSGELVILRVVEADGEEFLETIDDDGRDGRNCRHLQERLEEGLRRHLRGRGRRINSDFQEKLLHVLLPCSRMYGFYNPTLFKREFSSVCGLQTSPSWKKGA